MDKIIVRRLKHHIEPLRSIISDDYWDEFLFRLNGQADIISTFSIGTPLAHHDNPKELSRHFGAIAGSIQGLSDNGRTTLAENIMKAVGKNSDVTLTINRPNVAFIKGEMILNIMLEALGNPPAIGNSQTKRGLVALFCKSHLARIGTAPNAKSSSECYRIVSAIVAFYGLEGGYGFSASTIIKNM